MRSLAILFALTSFCGLAKAGQLPTFAKRPKSKLPPPPVKASKPKGPAAYGFKKVGPEGAFRITFKDLRIAKPLNQIFVKPKDLKRIPLRVRRLHGRRVLIRGLMSPSFKLKGLNGFMFGMQGNFMMFPGRTLPTELFPVIMRKGVTTDYIQNRRFDVVGDFRVSPWIEDGSVLRVYRIQDAVIVRTK